MLASAESSFQRPVMVTPVPPRAAPCLASTPTPPPFQILMDRGVDVPVMLHHPWTYHALAADTLDVRLNHITVESEEKGRKLKKTYDVDSSDPFWAENAGRIFPEVAE